MASAGGASPNAPLLGIGNAACGYPMTLWKGAHRPPYEGAESKVRARKWRLVGREPCHSGVERSSGCQWKQVGCRDWCETSCLQKHVSL